METKLLLTPEAAALLRVAPQTLMNWRISGKGPQFCKVGGRVLYETASLEKFVAASRSGNPAK